MTRWPKMDRCHPVSARGILAADNIRDSHCETREMPREESFLSSGTTLIDTTGPSFFQFKTIAAGVGR